MKRVGEILIGGGVAYSENKVLIGHIPQWSEWALDPVAAFPGLTGVKYQGNIRYKPCLLVAPGMPNSD